MNEMVERVARALVVAKVTRGVFLYPEQAEIVARAVIAAMREPTEAMVDAAWSAPDEPFRDIELGLGSGIMSIYSAMIDAALGEG